MRQAADKATGVNARLLERHEAGILDEPLLDAEDVATLLGIPKTSVYEYARDGRLPCIAIGRHKKFVRRDLAEAVARMRTG
jgi:excisionase family DNA binding protein